MLAGTKCLNFTGLCGSSVEYQEKNMCLSTKSFLLYALVVNENSFRVGTH